MKTARNGIIIIFFVVSLLAYGAMAFTLPVIEAGMTIRLFDLRMFAGYDDAYVATFVDQCSLAGVTTYRHVFFWLDLLYLLTAGMFFATWFHRTTGDQKWLWPGFLSIAFDLAENILVLRLLTSVVIESEVVAFASAMTIIKGFVYVFNYGIASYFAIRAVVRIRKKTR